MSAIVPSHGKNMAKIAMSKKSCCSASWIMCYFTIATQWWSESLVLSHLKDCRYLDAMEQCFDVLVPHAQCWVHECTSMLVTQYTFLPWLHTNPLIDKWCWQGKTSSIATTWLQRWQHVLASNLSNTAAWSAFLSFKLWCSSYPSTVSFSQAHLYNMHLDLKNKAWCETFLVLWIWDR